MTMSDNLQGIERLCEDVLARVLPIVQTLIGDPEATISNIVCDLEREGGARICLTTHSDTKSLSFYTLENIGEGHRCKPRRLRTPQHLSSRCAHRTELQYVQCRNGS